MRPRNVLASGLLLFVALQAFAQHGDAADGEREIEALISVLGASTCEFERNGRWYGGERAQAHLRRKYDYLRKRGLVGNAEQFIVRAASASSLSGKAYHVRCPGQGVVESAAWFRSELRRLRAKPAPAATR